MNIDKNNKDKKKIIIENFYKLFWFLCLLVCVCRCLVVLYGVYDRFISY